MTHIKMNKSYINPTEYQIILALYDGEKSDVEVRNILDKSTIDEIIRQLDKGNKDVMGLADTLRRSENIINLELAKLTNLGFIYRRDVPSKKPEGNKPGGVEPKYGLSEAGKKFYQSSL